MASLLDLFRRHRRGDEGSPGCSRARGLSDSAEIDPAGVELPTHVRAIRSRVTEPATGEGLRQPRGVDDPGDRFVLLREIAVGGFGRVFEATDRVLDRCVAIKLLHPQLHDHHEVVARFIGEARALARVQHPNVVSVMELGRHENGFFFIVEELLSGTSLRTQLALRPKLDLREALSIILPIMSGLVAVHECGIVHRDIKPENIVLARVSSGELVPKLVDFGIAKVYTRTQAITNHEVPLGTPCYMAPEQIADSAQVDERADVWAIASVLFEMLSGCCLYDGSDNRAVMNSILEAHRLEQALTVIPPGLAAILQRALAFDPDQRIRSIGELRDEIVEWCLEEYGSGWVSWIDPEPHDGPAVADGIARLHMSPRSRSEEIEASARALPISLSTPAFIPGVGAAEAEKSLRMNALRDAVELAERAIRADGGSDADIIAKMRLCQAIAHRWLGDYEETARCSGEAVFLFEPGSSGWCTAFGHLVMARGYLGKTDGLEAMASELAALDRRKACADGIAVAACRLAVWLIRAGLVGRARRMLRIANPAGHEPREAHPMVRAWSDVARAALALRQADMATYIHRVYSAMEGFRTAGDVRNESLQNANIGNAHLRLGDHEQAIHVFKKVLEVAQPLDVDFVVPVKVNLGLALAHAGRLSEAAAMEKEALKQAVRPSQWRFACVATVYLGLIRIEQGDLNGAEAILEDAIERTRAFPEIHAFAHGAKAQLLLRRKNPGASREHVLAALSSFIEVQDIEEGLREACNAGKQLEQQADRPKDWSQPDNDATGAHHEALSIDVELEWEHDPSLRAAAADFRGNRTLAEPAVVRHGEQDVAERAVEVPPHCARVADAGSLRPVHDARKTLAYWAS